MKNRILKKPRKPKLHRTGYEVLHFSWEQVRNAMAQFDPDPQMLKAALRIGHGIEIVDMPGAVITLYFLVPEFQLAKLKQYNLPETIMNLCGTCEYISTSEADVVARFTAAMTKDN